MFEKIHITKHKIKKQYKKFINIFLKEKKNQEAIKKILNETSNPTMFNYFFSPNKVQKT